MFKIVAQNDHTDLYDELIPDMAEAQESLASHQKQYPQTKLIIIGQGIEYWSANDLERNDISQNEANKLAETGYTMEDVHNMTNEDIETLLK